MADIEVRRDDLRTTRVTEGEARADAPADGEVQLQIERFGLTANNVTYGAIADMIGYWNFFPASEEGWGRVPVWGFGDVVASAVEGVAAGDRFYGYFPMSTYLTVRPEPNGAGFADTAEHRQGLPAFYNQYVRTPPDTPHQDEMLLLRPLFGTAFLLDNHLTEQERFGAGAVVLGSASSKTAYGLAFLLAEGGTPTIGLTSARNRAFVESLGVYDRVVAYDEIADGLAGDEQLVYVDMSGDGAVRAAVHTTAGERLRASIMVGVTHWENMAGPAEVPGPAPEMFFAPAHIERLRGEFGPGELQRRIDAAWDAFIVRVGEWMTIAHGEGVDEVRRAWGALVEGDVDPSRGAVLRLP